MGSISLSSKVQRSAVKVISISFSPVDAHYFSYARNEMRQPSNWFPFQRYLQLVQNQEHSLYSELGLSIHHRLMHTKDRKTTRFFTFGEFINAEKINQKKKVLRFNLDRGKGCSQLFNLVGIIQW